MRYWSLLSLIFLAGSAGGADTNALLKQLLATGPNGLNSAQAAAAWNELAKSEPDALVPMLSALDGAGPVAANWIRSAIDAVVEKAKTSKRELPVAELQKFLDDKKHCGASRRLAFELLCNADSKFRERTLRSFINDPAPELNYDAIQTAFEAAKQRPKDDAAAKSTLKALLTPSRNFEQIEEIAKELKARGEEVDLTDHFGFLTKWRVLGVFDNTGGKGYAAVFEPEAKFDDKATPNGKEGQPTKWWSTTTKAKYGAVDLNKLIDKLKNATAFAVCEVEADADRDVELRAASATAIKMFVNGQEVYGRESYHQSFTPDSHIAPAKLKKGKNVIMLKICQNDQKEPWAQEWQFQLRITDSTGQKVPVKNVTMVE
jgi:hypothetical protein